MEKSQDDIVTSIINSSLKEDSIPEIGKISDFAITLESKDKNEELIIGYGPYLGKSDLLRRPLRPDFMENITNIDFKGLMLESKFLSKETKMDFNGFIFSVKKLEEKSIEVWKKLVQ